MGEKAIRHAQGLETEWSGTVSLGPKGRHQQAQVTWPEDRSGGGSQTGRIQVEGWENTKGKQERRVETRQGRRDIREGRKKIIVMTRSKGGEIRQKEGKHTGEGERNQMRKRNLKWKKSEEGKRAIGQREGETRRGNGEIRQQEWVRNQKTAREKKFRQGEVSL